jgi:hypothetical protein
MPARWRRPCLSALERRASAVGKTVPSVGAGARAFAFGQGVRAQNTWEAFAWPATRRGRPGVESPQHAKRIVALFDNH